MQFSEGVTVLILYHQLAFTWFIDEKNVILEKNPARESQREKQGKKLFFFTLLYHLTDHEFEMNVKDANRSLIMIHFAA